MREYVVIASNDEAKRAYVIGPFAREEDALQWIRMSDLPDAETTKCVVTDLNSPVGFSWESNG